MRFTSSVIDNYDTYYAHKTSWAARDGVALTELVLRVPYNASILDVGCGGGEFLQQLHDAGYTELHAADYENHLSHIHPIHLRSFLTADLSAERLAYPDGTFAAITALAFLEHMENAGHFLREAARLLRPDGYLLVTMPNIASLPSRIRFLCGGHLDGYTKHNDHIMVLPREVFEKMVAPYFVIEDTIIGNAQIRIPFTNKKLRGVLPSLFGNKILYILKHVT